MNEDMLLRLWGKTNRPQNTAYHPLLFHMLDVALCAGQLWDRLPPTLQLRLANALGLSLERTRYAAMLLAGPHDIGKACPPFQHQSEPFRAQVRQAGFVFPTDVAGYNRPHGMVSAKEIARLLSEPDGVLRWNADLNAANILAAITGGHHGTFPTSDDLRGITSQTLGGDGEAARRQWKIARERLIQMLQELLPGYRADQPLQTKSIADCALVPLLAGLISVADWFGSSQHFAITAVKNAAPNMTVAQYMRQAEDTANSALNHAGWHSVPDANQRPSLADFATVFAYLDKEKPVMANAVQQSVATLVRNAREPYLLIVESAMGSGKTEAALYGMDCALANGLTHGFYVALPTQATSNAMHARIKAYFEQGEATSEQPRKGRIKGDVNLMLVHANAGLDENYLSLIVDKPIYDGQNADEDEIGRVIAQRWFTQQKKQALLAPFGVGTIDQALLSVLQTRHWFVRLFGLSGKCVCLDEVHAYDTYMSEILQRLLAWLAEMRCPVILLSATLPAGKRLELANAYCKGAKAKLEAREKELAAQGNPVVYPRLTFVCGERAEPIAIEDKTKQKPVELQFSPPDAEAILAGLRRNLPEGGCAAVICNTVDRAQEIYQALRDALKPEGWEVTLVHARTPFLWRQERERETLEAFGKDSGAKGTQLRPKRLLVSTQVIEQSLDLDFDLIFSDMAPIDLLLQRMGRLHRHKRVRVLDDLAHITGEEFVSCLPARFVVLTDGELTPIGAENETAPALNVTLPTPNGPPPVFSNAGIYDRYLLLRSWLALRDKRTITLPTDIQPLVTEVYDQDELTDAAHLPDPWPTILETEREKSKRESLSKTAEAEGNLIALPDEFTFDTESKNLSEDDDPQTPVSVRAATRDPDLLSIQAICFGESLEGEKLSPNYHPSLDALKMKAMLQYTVTISTKYVYHALLYKKQKTGWAENAFLRHHRHLSFTNGKCPELKLQLSRELGLVIGGNETDAAL